MDDEEISPVKRVSSKCCAVEGGGVFHFDPQNAEAENSFLSGRLSDGEKRAAKPTKTPA